MGVNTSFADYIADWRRLLHLLAININEGWLPDMPVLRGSLEAALVSLEQSTAQQDSIRADSKDNAAASREHLQLGSDAALQLRAAIRAHLGPRNPRLAEFRVKVLGSRRPKPALPEDVRPKGKGKVNPEALEPAIEPEAPAS